MACGCSISSPSRPLPSGRWPMVSTVASSIPTWMNCSRPMPPGAMTPSAPYSACTRPDRGLDDAAQHRGDVEVAGDRAVGVEQATETLLDALGRRGHARRAARGAGRVLDAVRRDGSDPRRSHREGTASGRGDVSEPCGVGSADDRDRAAGATQHVVADRSELLPLVGPQAARADDDQRGIGRRVDECLGRRLGRSTPSPAVRRGAPRGHGPPRRRPRKRGPPRRRCRGARARAGVSGRPGGRRSRAPRHSPVSRRPPRRPGRSRRSVGSRTTTTGQVASPAARRLVDPTKVWPAFP